MSNPRRVEFLGAVWAARLESGFPIVREWLERSRSGQLWCPPNDGPELEAFNREVFYIASRIHYHREWGEYQRIVNHRSGLADWVLSQAWWVGQTGEESDTMTLFDLEEAQNRSIKPGSGSLPASWLGLSPGRHITADGGYIYVDGPLRRNPPKE